MYVRLWWRALNCFSRNCVSGGIPWKLYKLSWISTEPLIRKKNALWMWDFDGEPWTRPPPNCNHLKRARNYTSEHCVGGRLVRLTSIKPSLCTVQLASRAKALVLYIQMLIQRNVVFLYLSELVVMSRLSHLCIRSLMNTSACSAPSI